MSDGHAAARVRPASSRSRSRRRWSAPSWTTPCRSSCRRALPDVRDGLKPVHRRILWGMYDLGVRPDRPHVKCARVTGDVMGKYHPHGDQAIYDALVRMAQHFSLRHPLIDGHGNFGSPDSSPPAPALHRVPAGPAGQADAGRHRRGHRRLRRQLRGRVRRSRAVLPARFPNLLVNGSQGIAVGMATNIPPHNLGEVIDATVHLIDNPEATPDDLMEFVKGPDFPTGGLHPGAGRDPRRLPHRPGLHPDAGQGRDRGGQARRRDRRHRAALPGERVESVAGEDRPSWSTPAQLEGIRDIKQRVGRARTPSSSSSSSATPTPTSCSTTCYKHTPLQTNFGVNMVALVDGVPRTLNLAQALTAYVDHQVEVITRRSEFRLRKAQDRAHIVEGLLKALDMIDAIIALIRASDDRRRRPRGPHGRALRVQRDPGQAHPRHDPVPPHPPGPVRARGGAGQAAGDHRRARGHPRRPGPAAAGHQGRAGRGPGQVRHSPAGPRSPSTRATSTSRTSSTTRSSSSP